LIDLTEKDASGVSKLKLEIGMDLASW